MFVTEALAGNAALLSEAIQLRLGKLEQLCPGDFAAVKRQTDILATEFSSDEFLDQLEAEHRNLQRRRSAGHLRLLSN